MTAVFLLLSSALFAQKDSTEYHPFSIGINFTTVPAAQIAGTDTSFQNALSVSPFIELRSRSGWGVVYSPSFASGASTSGIYMHTLSAGYERYGEKHMDVAFAYSHFFFTGKTAVPYSPLSNEVSLFLNYTHSWLRPVVAASFGFGTDTAGGASTNAHDMSVALGVNHGFSWEDKGVFSSIELTPAILLNGSTNGYFSFLSTSKYLSHSGKFIRYVKKTVKGGSSGRGRGNNSKPAATATSFELSNVEASMEAGLNIGAFTVRPGGSLFFPISAGTDNAPFAYGEVSVLYHF